MSKDTLKKIILPYCLKLFHIIENIHESLSYGFK